MCQAEYIKLTSLRSQLTAEENKSNQIKCSYKKYSLKAKGTLEGGKMALELTLELPRLSWCRHARGDKDAKGGKTAGLALRSRSGRHKAIPVLHILYSQGCPSTSTCACTCTHTEFTMCLGPFVDEIAVALSHGTNGSWQVIRAPLSCSSQAPYQILDLFFVYILHNLFFFFYNSKLHLSDYSFLCLREIDRSAAASADKMAVENLGKQ